MGATTRERILDATEGLIRRKGVGNVTVVEIERASGLAPGSGAFYRHFADKGAAYVAVSRRVVERALADERTDRRTDERADRAAGEGEAAVERCPVAERHEGLARRMDHVQRMRELFVLMMRDDGHHPEARDTLAGALLHLGRADCIEVTDRADPPAVELVVELAQVGYVLALEFFGDVPFGIDAERFVAALAEVVATPGGDAAR